MGYQCEIVFAGSTPHVFRIAQAVFLVVVPPAQPGVGFLRSFLTPGTP